MFADDTCLFIEVEDTSEAADLINNDLSNIKTWADQWLVTFSPPKTEEMVITTRNARHHPDLFLGTELITRVNNHKHLGVTLSNNLTWKDHIDTIVIKATKRLGIMRPLKHRVDRKTLETIYKSFIRPIMEYADILWDNPNDRSLDRLETIQQNAARIVTGGTKRCSREGLYNETLWESLQSRRSFHRLSLMFTIVHNTAPVYLRNLLPAYRNDLTNYNLRNRRNLTAPQGRLEVTRNSFFPSTVSSWNNLPQQVRDLPSINAFKSNHKNRLPKPNFLYNIGERLNQIIHARLRIGCSLLKFDLYHNLHVIPDSTCTCDLSCEETAYHFFFDCPLFTLQRIQLNHDMAPLELTNLSLETLLHGNPDFDMETNILVLKSIHLFFKSTERFST